MLLQKRYIAQIRLPDHVEHIAQHGHDAEREFDGDPEDDDPDIGIPGLPGRDIPNHPPEPPPL